MGYRRLRDRGARALAPRLHSLLVLAALLAVLAPSKSAASAVPAEVTVRTTAVGTWLMTGSGTAARALYVFDKDADARDGSACDAKCERFWPPLTVGAVTSANDEWTRVRRPSGSEQWTFKGKPLYTFAKDDTPSATYGDGIGRVWHLAFERVALPPGITLQKKSQGRCARRRPWPHGLLSR